MQKILHYTLSLALFIIISTNTFAQEQQKEKTIEERAIEQAEKMERDFELEPHQTFFIDSILRHDFQAMDEEIAALRKSGTQEYTAYKQVQDKWIKQIESAYEKVFTPDQWKKYLKSQGKLKKEKKSRKNKNS